MRDIVIDAETLDTKNTAVIPSIGARLCNLETGELGEGFHVKLNVQEQIDAGYTISASTLAFWMKQNDAARNYLIPILEGKTQTVSRQVGFQMLWQFIRNTKDAFAWGNGISFDLGLCIQEWGPDNLPWQFWAEQDVRSIVSFGKRVFGVEFKKSTQFEGVQHNPLDDATHEALYLMQYFSYGRHLSVGSEVTANKLHDAQFALQEARERIARLENPRRAVDIGTVNLAGIEQRLHDACGKYGPGSLSGALAVDDVKLEGLKEDPVPAIELAEEKLSDNGDLQAGQAYHGIAFLGIGPSARTDKAHLEPLFADELNLKINPHLQTAEVVICFGMNQFDGKPGQVVVKVDQLRPAGIDGLRPAGIDGLNAEQEVYDLWHNFLDGYLS